MNNRPTNCAIVPLVLCALGLSGTSGCHAVFWRSDLDGALREGTSKGKATLVYYWSPVNADCLKMDSEVFQNPDVLKTMSDMVPVRLASGINRAWAESVGIGNVPAFAIYRSDGQLVRIREGVLDEARFRGLIVNSRLSE